MRHLFIGGMGIAIVVVTASCSSRTPSPIRRGGGHRLSIAQDASSALYTMEVREGYRHRYDGDKRVDAGGTAVPDTAVEVQPPSAQQETTPRLPSRDRLIAFLPVSGSVASMGKAVERGIVCALRQQSEEQMPEVVVVDAGQEGEAPRAALVAALKNSPPPVAIVGPFLSSQVTDVATIAREHRVISFNLSKRAASSEEDLVDLGFSIPAQLTALIRDGIIRASISRLAIARSATPFSQELAAELRKLLSGTAVQVVFDGAYGATEDFAAVKELVQKLEETPVDGVFIADTVQGASRLLSSMGSSLRSRVKVFGPGAWYNMTALRAAQGVFDNTIFPVPFVVGDGDSRFEKLDRCLPPRRNRGADFLSALGFDVGTIIAMQREGRVGEYNGLTGTFAVDERRVKRTVAIGIFGEGTIRPFRPVIRSLADVLSPGSGGNGL